MRIIFDIFFYVAVVCVSLATTPFPKIISCYNIEDFTKGIIEFNSKDKLHLDIMFAFKVRIFELDQVKKKLNEIENGRSD